MIASTTARWRFGRIRVVLLTRDLHSERLQEFRREDELIHPLQFYLDPVTSRSQNMEDSRVRHLDSLRAHLIFHHGAEDDVSQCVAQGLSARQYLRAQETQASSCRPLPVCTQP